MYLHLRSQVYYIASLVIIQSHGYVLLAANLEDFRSIAKKFVPEPLADQIVDMAQNQPMKYRQPPDPGQDSESESESKSKENVKTEEFRGPIERETEKHVQYAKVNFEELVQKVKDRIQKDLEQTLMKTNFSPKQNFSPKEKQIREYGQERMPPVSRFVNGGVRKTTKFSKPKLERQEKPRPTPDDSMTFAKITMKENDSYEDYVTPKKARNVYASDVEKPDKIQTTTFRQMPDYTNQETESPMETAYNDKTEELKENVEELIEKSREIKIKSEEIKAKTEDMWYDEKQTIATEDYATTPSDSKTTKKSRGTMIPKRDFYKISSPNYLARVPIVAEKYDFDEPIPERDRDPENVKALRGLPPPAPANINGKVKIS